MSTIKSSSKTWSSANDDATIALWQTYSHILSTLFEIFQDKYENANTQIKAIQIFKNVEK